MRTCAVFLRIGVAEPRARGQYRGIVGPFSITPAPRTACRPTAPRCFPRWRSPTSALGDARRRLALVHSTVRSASPTLLPVMARVSPAPWSASFSRIRYCFDFHVSFLKDLPAESAPLGPLFGVIAARPSPRPPRLRFSLSRPRPGAAPRAAAPAGPSAAIRTGRPAGRLGPGSRGPGPRSRPRSAPRPAHPPAQPPPDPPPARAALRSRPAPLAPRPTPRSACGSARPSARSRRKSAASRARRAVTSRDSLVTRSNNSSFEPSAAPPMAAAAGPSARMAFVATSNARLHRSLGRLRLNQGGRDGPDPSSRRAGAVAALRQRLFSACRAPQNQPAASAAPTAQRLCQPLQRRKPSIQSRYFSATVLSVARRACGTSAWAKLAHAMSHHVFRHEHAREHCRCAP
jgi:hypothetical protein